MLLATVVNYAIEIKALLKKNRIDVVGEYLQSLATIFHEKDTAALPFYTRLNTAADYHQRSIFCGFLDLNILERVTLPIDQVPPCLRGYQMNTQCPMCIYC